MTEKVQKNPKKQINFMVSEEQYNILQGIAEAFYKSGVIDKPSIPKLVIWNTRKLVEDVMTRRREQLRTEFLKQEEQVKKKEMVERYPGIFGNEIQR